MSLTNNMELYNFVLYLVRQKLVFNVLTWYTV